MRLSSDTATAIGESSTDPYRRREGRPEDSGTLLEEAFVVAHHQLGLELLHRVEGDAHNDQQRGAAEEEVRVRLRDEERRQGGDRREVQGAGEGEAREDAVQELRGRAAGPHAGDEPAV